MYYLVFALMVSTLASMVNGQKVSMSDTDKLRGMLRESCKFLDSFDRPVANFSESIKVNMTFNSIKFLGIEDATEK